MTEHSMLEQIYLDSNATTQVHPAASKAALEAMEYTFGNPSSSHISGLRAKNLMEQTRDAGKKLLGVKSGKFIFTSGATEGIQTAILSALCAAKNPERIATKPCLLYGATEHKAVPESLKHWNHILGIHAEIKAIPVDTQGKLDLEFIAEHAADALIICTMAVNNETGVFQDLAQLENVIRSNNPDVFWMVDCVQALGKIELNLETTTIDYAPFSGHKLYAPKGIGFVYIRDSAPFTSFIAGGGQESGLRSGTENLPGMAALKVIFDILNHESDHHFASHSEMRQYQSQLITSLQQAFPNLVLNHCPEHSVPTTINFSVPHFSSKEIMDLFDAANIRVSSGSACSSKVTRSFVLDAMGLPTWQSESAIRLSFGPMMTNQECKQACKRIALAAKALGQSCLNPASIDSNVALELNGLLELKQGNSCCWLYCDNDSKETVIIDPLFELIPRIESILQCQQLNLVAVLDTHGHADHQSAREQLLHHLPEHQIYDALGWPQTVIPSQINGIDGSYITVGDNCLFKFTTPGHTADSVSYILTNKVSERSEKQQSIFAFCGDTILIDSLGRTNFDTSSAKDMYASLLKLSQLLDKDTVICASHDYHNQFTTTLATESNKNQLLANVLSQRISVDEFVIQKGELDTHLNDQQGCEIQCGAYVNIDNALPIVEYDKHTLAKKLDSDCQLKLVDIREPHEYSLQHTQQENINVPMTRMVQFIQENISHKEQEFILVCRSGTRSSLAAQALSRLGFKNIGHLKGGYALS